VNERLLAHLHRALRHYEDENGDMPFCTVIHAKEEVDEDGVHPACVFFTFAEDATDYYILPKEM